MAYIDDLGQYFFEYDDKNNSFIIKWKPYDTDHEDEGVINIEDVDYMEADEFGDGYWYFSYTGKKLTQEQIDELKLNDK